MINVKGEAHKKSVAGEDELTISETFFTKKKKKKKLGEKLVI